MGSRLVAHDPSVGEDPDTSPAKPGRFTNHPFQVNGKSCWRTNPGGM